MVSSSGKTALPSLVFEVTTECNLACKYCYNVWNRPESRREKKNSYRQAKKALKKLYSQAEVSNISLSGGEPFLGERFLELLLYCRLKKSSVTLITNGTKASRDDLSSAAELGVSLFELPFHSHEPAPHDAMTGKKGTWLRSKESIEHLLDLGGSVVGVIVLTRLNHHAVEQTLLAMADMGLSRVMLNRFNVGGRGILYRSELEPSHDELRDAFEVANKVASTGKVRVFSSVCSPMCVLDPRDYPRVSFSHCATEVERRPLTLDIDGNIRFCNHSPVKAGNIFRKDLPSILGGAYFQTWSTTVPSACGDCELFERCQGGCRAASEQLGHGLDRVDPLVDTSTVSPFRSCPKPA